MRKPKWIKKLTLFGAGALSVALTTAQAANTGCADCAVVAHQQAMGKQVFSPSILNTGIDVGNILRRSTLIQFPSLAQAAAAQEGQPANKTEFTPNWDGSGPLPGAIQLPQYSGALTDLNPSFETDFYSNGRAVNTASAPWNQYLPPELARVWYGPIQTMQQAPTSFFQGPSVPPVIEAPLAGPGMRISGQPMQQPFYSTPMGASLRF